MKKITFYFLIALPLLLSGCSKDEEPNNDINVEATDQKLYFGDEYQIRATSNKPITYTSDNEYHAEVSGAGLVSARFVGETTILLENGNDTKEVPVTVHPKSTLYPEPELDFGIGRSALLDRLGTPDAQDETGIAYFNYSVAAPMKMYFFDENHKMESLVILVKTLYSSELGTFLSERYLPADTESLIFINGLEESDVSMIVGAELYDADHWMVIYVPYAPMKRTSGLKTEILTQKVDAIQKQLGNRTKF